eukprot:SAG31_NODE_3339_length_4386_cov_39.128528_7_plen_155_part_00
MQRTNRETITMYSNVVCAAGKLHAPHHAHAAAGEAVRVVTFSFLCPLLEKYGTFIARCNALIEKVSSFRVYATMTPFQPQKYLNPCRPNSPVLDPCNDVEAKNALAVKTVKSVSPDIAINDLYSVVTNRCGKVYRDCSICDNETKYHLTTWNGI